ncbi:hypothetical protein NHX12_034316 [Muraenolepis orangiensis]|uniref:Uncharacterized protein n=1 Tax=Muraenolepis orangiensis TaxID=630683 RepID=A0A9Q0I0X1_9TELE|nr:hypothetical protein NHX12_034316 [Muraenolepis orangiensis]
MPWWRAAEVSAGCVLNSGGSPGPTTCCHGYGEDEEEASLGSTQPRPSCQVTAWGFNQLLQGHSAQCQQQGNYY